MKALRNESTAQYSWLNCLKTSRSASFNVRNTTFMPVKKIAGAAGTGRLSVKDTPNAILPECGMSQRKDRELANGACQLIGVLVTYRRANLLPKVFASISQQSAALSRLIVVDNENSAATKALVNTAATSCNFKIEYVTSGSNLGSAGGWDLGIRHALSEASDGDWIMPLDDDNPPLQDSDFQEMLTFANNARSHYQRLAGTGIVGARFDWRRGTLARLKDHEICRPIEVDVLGSGHLPLYSVSALRAVGGFDPQLFFGMSEVELGLRFKRAGYQLVANGDMWLRRRRCTDAAGRRSRPFGRCVVSWRTYYVTRNYIYMMMKFGRADLACRRAVRELFLKPMLTAIWYREPATAWRSMRLALRAAIDGFLRRMGRTVEPIITSPCPVESDSSQDRSCHCE